MHGMPPRHSFLEFLSTREAQAVLWMAVLAVLLMAAYYLVQKLRDRTGDDHLTSNELLTNFREMEREGDISEAEFRTIKTVLGERLQSEIKDSSDEG
jgi:uncharacterized protein YpuA (DUF1002 family)